MIQYIKLIDDMTNNVDIEERVEIKKLIGESKSNLESAKLLIDNVKHLHWHTIADFWDGLVMALEKNGYEVLQNPTEEDFSDIVHGSSRKRNNASLSIVIKTSSPFNILIEEYPDELYFGVTKEQKLPKQYVKTFATLVANNEEYEDDENWYIWKYPSIPEDEYIDSWDINNDATFRLIDDSFRLRITAVIIDDITKFIKDVEGCLKAAEENR